MVKCPFCEKNGRFVQEKTLTIKVIFENNPILFNLVPLTNFKTLVCDPSVPLWKKVWTTKELTPLVVGEHLPFVYKKFYILNQEKNLYPKIMDLLLNSVSAYETCQMCFCDVNCRFLIPSCGSCNFRICLSCFDQWYSLVSLGNLVFESNSLCPFCKSIPTFKLIQHLDLGFVKNLRGENKLSFSEKFYYACCKSCFTVKEYCEKQCLAEIPVVSKWSCSDCIESVEIQKNVKNCPNCDIMVEKQGGCNHITCVCNTHWCWSCRSYKDEKKEKFNKHNIYDHMANCEGIF